MFVKSNFRRPATELVRYPIPTYDTPEWMGTIEDATYRGWLNELHQAWANLTFHYDMSKICEGCATSTLHVQRPFVVPGGRFREFYYW